MKNFQFYKVFIITLFATMLLSGCGSHASADINENTGEALEAKAVDIHESLSAPASLNDDSGTPSQEEFSYENHISTDEIVQLTNEYRISQGVQSLTVDEKLQQAAQIRAEELAAYGDIRINGKAHVRPDGSSWSTVLKEVEWGQGTSCRINGENCGLFAVSAAHPAESSTLVNGWINSESHRLNMIDSRYTQIGVGVAWNGDTCFGVQLFGYSS